MKIFYIFVLVYTCLYPLYCNSVSVRPICNSNICNRTKVEICATNGQQCKRFSNECALQSDNCNTTLATVWNRTDRIQCINLRSNASGICACPALRTCSNQPTTTGICAHRVGHDCRLFRTECDLARARCNGEVMTRVSRVQCTGFQPGEGRACACPRLNTCSRSNTNICVMTGRGGCMLLRNECDLEQAICEGERFIAVDNIQCRNFTFNQLRYCSCPSMGICEGDDFPICTIANRSQCKLFRNQCDLEKARCQGEVLSVNHPILCRHLMPNVTGDCFCPRIRNCLETSGSLCVRENNNNGSCLLLRNKCALEEAICEGKDFKQVNNIHCRNFTINTSRMCVCPNLKTCNTNSSSICVMTAGQQCRLMRNECELEQAKCEGENLQITHDIQCLNFDINTQRNCSCPNLSTCPQNSTKICARTSGGCKLLTTKCQLEEAKCSGEVLGTTSLQHCLGLELGQVRNCTSPNLNTCSRNSSNICVKTDSGCRLIRNECELEQLRREGENLRILPAIQCKLIRPGNNGSCACPNWLTCQQNSTNVCIETLSGCSLLKNQCEFEKLICQREALNITSNLQCQGFAVGQQRLCACPELKTCSNQNSTNICARNSNSCKLMAHSCDFELAKCNGEKWCSVDSDQCQNFSVGQQRNCTCPNMNTCSKNNSTNICVHMKGACKLMKNHCELEKAKCKGQAWSPTSAIQCQNYKPNEWRWCACPRLLNCCSKQKQFCVKGPRGCKLMKTDCKLQMARCKGEEWSRADDLECKGFRIGQTEQNCTCPKLATCQRNNSLTAGKNLCVRNVKGCKLLRNDCELERSLCTGEVWQPVENLQCQNFPFHETRSCICPSLETCSNTTRVCGKMPGNQCSLFRSECDMRWSQCEGKTLSLTLPQRCQSFRFDTPDECRCPELRGCNRRLRICGRKGPQCKLFRNECDFRNSTCLEENWQRTSMDNCCKFASEEVKTCTLSMATAVCGMLSNQCRLFSSRCAFDAFNLSAPRKWRLVSCLNCQCIRTGRTAKCARRPVCRPTIARRVCGRHGINVMLFNSQCHSIQHNYRRCTNFRAVRTSECRNITG